MKAFFLFSALALACNAQAQDKPTKPSLKNLEEKYGFRDAHFEADTTDFKDLVLLGHDKNSSDYTRTGDSKTIGDATLKDIHYSFYKGKLESIILKTEGYNNSQALLAALQAQYGPGDKTNPYRKYYLWGSKRVLMSFTQNSVNDDGSVLITSRVVYAKQKTDDAAAAKKAASDL